MLGILLSVVTFGLVIFALIDLITTDNSAVKHLPKIMWVVVILILPLIGSIIWLLVGKDRVLPEGLGTFGDAGRRATGTRQAEVRTATSAAGAAAFRDTTPEEDEARVEAEIAFHENQARIRRLEQKLKSERGSGSTS